MNSTILAYWPSVGMVSYLPQGVAEYPGAILSIMPRLAAEGWYRISAPLTWILVGVEKEMGCHHDLASTVAATVNRCQRFILHIFNVT